MSKNAQRLSQVVSTFGPGAMVDLPTRSVVIGGLELWDMRGGSFALYFTAYNWIRIHKTLRVTPAMAAGLTNNLLNWEDIAEMVDAREATRRKAA
jgi:hypothetical protein